jgi:hypothetical protein
MTKRIGPLAGRHDHQRIDEADMVADDHRRAVLRHRSSFHTQPVHRVDQHPDDEAQQELGHQAVDEQRHRRVADRGDGEQHAGWKAGGEQPAAASAPTTMNSAFMMLLAAMMRAPCSGLERCCTRAYSGTMKKPPKMPISGQVGSTRQVEPSCNRAIAPAGGRRRRRGQGEVEREQRQADRTQRHQAELDALAAESFSQAASRRRCRR